MNNWKLRHSFTGNATSDVQTVNGYLASGEDNDFAVTVVPDGKEYAAPLVVPRTNLVDYSEGLDAFSGGATETLAPSELNPNGSSGTVVEISNFQGATGDRVQLYVVDVVPTLTYTGSLYVKGTNGQTIKYYIKRQSGGSYVGSSQILHTFNGSWQRIQATFTTLSDTIACSFFLINDASATADTFFVWGGQIEQHDKATEYIPTNGAAVTRSWDSFSRVQNQVPGISNGTHTHTGAASGGGIAATTLTGTGSGGKFKYEFDTLGKLVLIEATDAGSGYKVGDKLSIDTTEGHTIEFRLVEGSNAATVSVSMDATRPNKPIPFPVSKMRVEGLTDRTVLFLDKRSQYVFPKPTPYLLDTYEGAAAAYSLRRLRSAYTGPAVRVRRASNNDELDIYFNRDGSLDTATLEAFCAGTDGFVKVWYDQGQEGNDMSQTTTANQPTIVSSGSVISRNNKPAIINSISGSSSLRLTYSVVNGSWIFAVGQVDTAWTALAQGDISAKYLLGAKDLTSNSPNSYVSNVVTYVDGTLQSMTTQDAVFDTFQQQRLLSLSFDNNSWTQFNIGYPSSANVDMMTMQELILYPSDQSANRTAIEDNINEHYDIYP